MIMSASSFAQKPCLGVGFFWHEILISYHWDAPLCSFIAAPLLSQDWWGGFNLIIAADVGPEYFVKHLLSREKLSE